MQGGEGSYLLRCCVNSLQETRGFIFKQSLLVGSSDILLQEKGDSDYLKMLNYRMNVVDSVFFSWIAVIE